MFSFFVIFLGPTPGPWRLPLRLLCIYWRTWTLMRWVIPMMSMWSMLVLFVISTMLCASLPRVIPSPPFAAWRWMPMSFLLLSLLRWWLRGWMSAAVFFLSVDRRWWGWWRVPPSTPVFPSLVIFIRGISVSSCMAISFFSLLSTTIVGIINITNARTLCCYLWFSRCRLRLSWSRLRRYITEFTATWKRFSLLKLFYLLKCSLSLLYLLFLPTFLIKLIFDQIFRHTQWWCLCW